MPWYGMDGGFEIRAGTRTTSNNRDASHVRSRTDGGLDTED